MKILIITYNREVNPGTFLQGYGVQHAFRQLCPDATIHMIRHKRAYSFIGGDKPRKRDWNYVKSKIAALPRRLKYEWCNAHYFRFPQEEFDFFNYDEEKFKAFAETYDLIVVGSDTVLIDLKKNGRYGLMWLLGVNTNKLLFAASAAPANFCLTDDDVKQLHESFDTFKIIGVRDSVTYNLLSDKVGLGMKVFKMFDPTFLIPSDRFHLPMMVRRKLQSIKRKRKLALVNFGDKFEGKRAVTEYLKQQGYYTISTLYNQWADKNYMTFSPFEWAAMFSMIDITITERFHDSVFTLRNNKPVIAIDWNDKRFAQDGSSKTSDLVHSYGLDKLHYIYKSSDDISVITSLIDFANVLFDEKACMEVNERIQEDYKSRTKEIESRLRSNLLIDINGG